MTRVAASFARQGIMATLGVSVAEVADGRVVLDLPFRDDLTQQHGFLHAGVVTTVIDSACGYAAFTLMPEGAEVLTVEFKVSFLAPARGDRFRCEGRVIKAGRTLTFTEGRAIAIADGAETLVATMTATMMAVTGRTPG